MFKNLISRLWVLGILSMLMACYYNKVPAPVPVNFNKCDTSKVSYANDIVPILKANCYSCHALSFTTFSFAIYQNVQQIALDSSIEYSFTGKYDYLKMPPSCDLTPCEVAKIKAWTMKGAPEN